MERDSRILWNLEWNGNLFQNSKTGSVAKLHVECLECGMFRNRGWDPDLEGKERDERLGGYLCTYLCEFKAGGYLEGWNEKMWIVF